MSYYCPFDEVPALAVLLPEGVHVLSKKATSDRLPKLVTAFGVERRLKLLAGYDQLRARMQQQNRSFVERELSQRCQPQHEGKPAQLVSYFLQLCKAVLQRDLSSEFKPNDPNAKLQGSPKLDRILPLVEQGLPFPQLPIPSIWLQGRLWLLKPGQPGRKTWRIHSQSDTLAMTGEYAAASEIDRIWNERVRRFTDKAGEHVRQLHRALQSIDDVSLALQQLETSGSITRADLVFIGATKRIGAILDKHFNLEMGKLCDRSLCVTAALDLPPKRPGAVSVYRLAGTRWIPYSPKLGLCMSRAPNWQTLDAPGLSLASYLRAVARHYSQNGRFHE